MLNVVRTNITASVIITGTAACSSAASTTPTAASNATPSVSAVAAPETAAQFVKSIGATRFTAGNMKGGLGGLTGGNAYLKGKKLGINCFASNDAMKSWLKSAEQLGVAPQLESSTCVAYPSVS